MGGILNRLSPNHCHCRCHLSGLFTRLIRPTSDKVYARNRRLIEVETAPVIVPGYVGYEGDRKRNCTSILADGRFKRESREERETATVVQEYTAVSGSMIQPRLLELAPFSYRTKEVAILTSNDNREQLLSANLFIATRRAAESSTRSELRDVDHSSLDRGSNGMGIDHFYPLTNTR